MKSGASSQLPLYIAGPDALGFTFSYPKEFLQSVEWDTEDIDRGGDGHDLAFLQASEVAHFLARLRQAMSAQLVPFARGDSSRDTLFCFDAADSTSVVVVDLGEKPSRARLYSTGGYVRFINAYRAS